MSRYRISQLAERTGVPASTLRFYEDSGLLEADRTPSGYRTFDKVAVDQLAFISSAKLMGLALGEIRELLQVWRSGVCASVRTQLAPMIDHHIADTQRRTAELSAFASRLHRVRSRLSDPAPDGECGPACGCMIADTPPKPTATAAVPDLGRDTAPLFAPTSSDPVTACALSRDGLGERTQQWREVLDHARNRGPLERDETKVGLVVSFANDAGLFTQLAHLIAAEQHCCSFYAFTLHISGDDVVMEVRAPRDAQPLMTELFGAAA